MVGRVVPDGGSADCTMPSRTPSWPAYTVGPPTSASCTCLPSLSRSGSPGGSGSCFAWILPRQSVGAINRRGSMVPHFNALVLQLMELLEALGLEAVVRHLPGKEKVLSDGIYRLSGEPDPSDWMLSPAVFHAIYTGRLRWTRAAMLWATTPSARCSLTRSWAGKVVWCHPPVGEAEAFLQHFWRSSCEAPEALRPCSCF